MGRNIEIKARLADPQAVKSRVEAIAEGDPVVLEQEDVFFRSRSGRLKLRKTSDGAELIYYERSDDPEPAESQYLKTSCSDGPATEAMLSLALGIRGIVGKRRSVYRVGQTRVHLDEVENLGAFLELEVTLGLSEDAAEGEDIARALMEKLGIERGDLVAGAYIDLLEGEGAQGSGESVSS